MRMLMMMLLVCAVRHHQLSHKWRPSAQWLVILIFLHHDHDYDANNDLVNLYDYVITDLQSFSYIMMMIMMLIMIWSTFMTM